MDGGEIVMVKHMLIAAAAVGLAGCSSMSGYDGSSQFSCAAPTGVTCMSMSGVNANVDAGTIGATQAKRGSEVSHAKPEGYYGDSTKIAHVAIKSGMPIRTAPRKMRVWWAPWEDSDGDVNDQSYSYMVIDSGHWLMERVRSNVVQKFMPSSESSAISSIKVGNVVPASNAAPAQLLKPPPATLGQSETGTSTPAGGGAVGKAVSGALDGAVKGAANAANKFPEFGEVMKKVMPNAN